MVPEPGPSAPPPPPPHPPAAACRPRVTSRGKRGCRRDRAPSAEARAQPGPGQAEPHAARPRRLPCSSRLRPSRCSAASGPRWRPKSAPRDLAPHPSSRPTSLPAGRARGANWGRSVKGAPWGVRRGFLPREIAPGHLPLAGLRSKLFADLPPGEHLELLYSKTGAKATRPVRAGALKPEARCVQPAGRAVSASQTASSQGELPASSSYS